MTDIQPTAGDRLRLEVLVKSLADGGTHLAVLSPHDAVLDYFATQIDERLRADPQATVELCLTTNSERLVQKFNDILSRMTLSQALDKQATHAPRHYLIFRDSVLIEDAELQLLARLVNGFPAGNIGVVLLLNSRGAYRQKIAAFGKTLVPWEVETTIGAPRPRLPHLVDPLPPAPQAGASDAQALWRQVEAVTPPPAWRIPAEGDAQAVPATPAPLPPPPTMAGRTAGAAEPAKPRTGSGVSSLMRRRMAWAALAVVALVLTGWGVYQLLSRVEPIEAVSPKAARGAAAPAATEPQAPTASAAPAAGSDAASAPPAAAPVQPVAQAERSESSPAPQVAATPDEAWIEQLPASSYVVQLASFDTESEMLSFQRKDPVYQQAKVLELRRKDKRYYVLVAGPMPSRAQAETYLQSHPLLAQGWVRSARSLRAKR